MGDAVEFATEEEVERSRAALLAEIGLSYDELEAQAQAGEFSSEAAREAWFTLAPLGGDWGAC